VNNIIVALDCPSRSEADRVIDVLGDAATSFKIGIQTLVAAGPGLARDLIGAGKSVFLDLKLHEVPNSVAGAVRAAGDLGATMVTVHASGGPAVLGAAVQAGSSFPELRVLALTVITSLGDDDLPAIGVRDGVGAQVDRLARLAADSGCDGVVCSVHEAAGMRDLWGAHGLVVTPGIGLSSDVTGRDDQVRVGTPEHARICGASHIILGRSLTQATDPLAAYAEAQRQFLG
jgi:orotidine-5'-phosphate decarboxylase